MVVPVRGSWRGVVIGCGINPGYGDIDPYHMAMCAVDEAIRNVVAVGADPERIALLDNFSWGDCNDPEVLGAMVRAARGCHDAAMLYRAPFISGKDSLNNEFRCEGKTIRIPHTLLVSALGQIDDVTRAVTSDLKRAGSRLILVGETRDENVPEVRETAPLIVRDVARVIRAGSVLACHDLSEGGLAVAAAEMSIGGDLGVRIETDVDLFAESATRFLLEVAGETGLDVPHAVVGEVTEERVLDFGSFRNTLDEARAAYFAWENLL